MAGGINMAETMGDAAIGVMLLSQQADLLRQQSSYRVRF